MSRPTAVLLGPALSYSHHLVGLVARAEAAAARLGEADPDRRRELAARARRTAARLSARLDGSPLEDATAAAVDRREAAGLPPAEVPPSAPGRAARGWAGALKLDGLPTQDVAAVEYANLLACHDVEAELAGAVFEAPLDTLESLHATLCAGLVDPGVVGRPRRTEQAIHDGAQGQVIHRAPAPATVPGRLEALAAWLGAGSATLPALVVAGAVHERLLEWQPFEAANGRLARAFARLVLRARGLDPHGLAVPERAFSADPVGYYGEVAATVRRRGALGPWLERWGEALCSGLELAVADACPPVEVSVPRHAARFAAELGADEGVTLAAYAARLGVTLETARAEVAALERAGALRLVPGTRGLRWRRSA
jgi:hypothetical protein